MKAAVLHQAGEIPRCEDVPDPIPREGEQLVRVKAASIKNLDRMRAQGSHYDSYKSFPVIVGVDGIGVLDSGARVYGGSPNGMMAEKAALSAKWMVLVPDGLDDITAAAIPNPGVSAWLSLEWEAKLQKGDSVLIMGATGTTGRLAVQIARHLGAGRIVAMGRSEAILQTLPALGADQVISLRQNDEKIKEALKEEMQQNLFDVVLDYCWGHPAEMLLDTLTGNSLHAKAHVTRYVQIGEMAGATIQLAAATLRSSAIKLSGAGGGSLPVEVMMKIPTVTLPEIFRLAAAGRLSADTEAVPLKEVEEAWQRQDLQGKRLVITMD